MASQGQHQSSFSRRQFLAGVATVGAALSFPASVARGSPFAPNGERKAPRCIHGFAKTLQWLSAREAAELLAEAGYEGIEYAVRSDGHIRPEQVETELADALVAARRSGLRSEMIATSIIDPRAPEAEHILRTAAKLGIRYYRMGVISYDPARPVWQTLQEIKPVLRDLAALNRQCGIRGVWQNHATVHGISRVGGPGWDLYELLRDLDPEWIGCEYDIRHASAENGPAWPLTMRLLQPWIMSTALKDFRWIQSPGRTAPEEMPVGEGIVDFAAYFQLERELQIGGPVSVHFFYPPFEPEENPLSPGERRRHALSALRRDLGVIRAHMSRQNLG